MPLGKIKAGIGKFFSKEEAPEYIEIDLGQELKKNKVVVRPFVLKHLDEVSEVLNALREGYTIAVIDISTFKKKNDVIDLKRAISKIKKTADALEGSIAGFGENTIIVSPSFAQIHKPEAKPKQKNPESELI